ncbi:MAG: DUF1566 domain-containing protein [Nitrospinae bacterium]|nr:DUF1566 domain-containing protein [Nitrospinota bacterium]
MVMDSPRYVDNENGTITDSWTGLMWQENYSYVETGNYVDWYEAGKYVERLNQSRLGDHDDWRLPDKLEIQTLYQISHPFESRGKTYILHIDPIFEFSYGSCFWTDKTRLSAALGFEFYVGDMHWYPKARLSGCVRAVRLNMNPFKMIRFYEKKQNSRT